MQFGASMQPVVAVWCFVKSKRVQYLQNAYSDLVPRTWSLVRVCAFCRHWKVVLYLTWLPPSTPYEIHDSFWIQYAFVCYLIILRGIDMLSGEGNYFQNCFVLFWKGINSIKKEFAHTEAGGGGGGGGGKLLFLYRGNPFPDRDWCAGKQTESHKSCLPCNICNQNPQMY